MQILRPFITFCTMTIVSPSCKVGDGLGVEGHRRSPAESDAQYEEASSLAIAPTCLEMWQEFKAIMYNTGMSYLGLTKGGTIDG